MNFDVKLEDFTKSELEILELMSKGLTNEEIAETRKVSCATVKNFLANIYSKIFLGENKDKGTKRLLTVLVFLKLKGYLK